MQLWMQTKRAVRQTAGAAQQIPKMRRVRAQWFEQAKYQKRRRRRRRSVKSKQKQKKQKKRMKKKKKNFHG